MRIRHLGSIVALVFAAAAQAQTAPPAPAATFFKCTDAQGKAHFSDIGCGKMSAVPVTPSDTANLQNRKVQNDARVERDKRLAEQLEADRIGAAQQARTEREKQLSVDNAVAGRQAAERATRNSAATSVLTPSECLGCVTLGR